MVAPILSEEVTQLHAEICSALGDSRRILLLYLLAEKSYTVNELTEKLSISQPATSRHLKVLHERGLVRTNHNGSRVEYSISDLRLIQALDLLRAVLKDDIVHRASLVEVEY